MIVACPHCAHQNSFEQPYPYHAGFGNQGFLYNDTGDRTLVWSSYDSAWTTLAGPVHPWGLDAQSWSRVEAALAPLSDGTRWRLVTSLGVGPVTRQSASLLLKKRSIISSTRKASCSTTQAQMVSPKFWVMAPRQPNTRLKLAAPAANTSGGRV